MNKLYIEVSKEDIDNGVRECILECPVALAAIRATGAGGVAVYEHCLIVTRYDNNDNVVDEKLYHLPASVTKWIEEYDRFGAWAVDPFTFDIEVEG